MQTASPSTPVLRPPLSGVVIAFNEADRIGRCVASLAATCAEVIVVDSGSRDDTVALARQAGARVVHQAWLGFSAQKNFAIAQATQPWVLLLDADEWLEPRACEGVMRLFERGRDGGDAMVETADVWRLSRRTRFLGTVMRFGGWGNEAVERLFRADVRYLSAQVHEKLDLDGRRIRQASIRVEHDTARSHQEYVDKLDRYAQLWADQQLKRGRRANRLSAPLHALAYWLKNVVLRGGMLDGLGGLRYHGCHTRYVYRKYERLRMGARSGGGA